MAYVLWHLRNVIIIICVDQAAYVLIRIMSEGQLSTNAGFWNVLESVTDIGLCRNVLHYVAACVRISWRCYKAGGCDRPSGASGYITIIAR